MIDFTKYVPAGLFSGATLQRRLAQVNANQLENKTRCTGGKPITKAKIQKAYRLATISLQ